MIQKNRDGSYLIEDERTPGRTLNIAAGDPAIESKIATFFGPLYGLPTDVPMYRVKVILAQQGLNAAVSSAIAAMAEPQKTIATILLNEAPNLEVFGDFATQLRTALGISDADYAAMIRAAVALAL